MLFFLTFYSSKNPKKYHRLQNNIKQHNIFNIDNNSAY